MGIAAQLHGSYDNWIGQRICMCCVPFTLRDVCTELKVAKESVREMNVKRLSMAHSPAHRQPISPCDAEQSLGYVQ